MVGIWGTNAWLLESSKCKSTGKVTIYTLGVWGLKVLRNNCTGSVTALVCLVTPGDVW